MTAAEKLKNLERANTVLTTGAALSQGISKDEFYRYVKSNCYERIGHGVYARKDMLIDDLYLLHLRCPRAVFSHDEALYYHGLVDREPLKQTLTIYSGYNTKRLVETDVQVFTVKKELLDFGKIEVIDFYGNIIPMYDMERTICDLIRSRRRFEIQDFQTALKSYAMCKYRKLDKLMRYASIFHVENILRKYMEVII